MAASAGFPDNKSNILRVVSTTDDDKKTTLSQIKDNAADTTKDFWRGFKDWFIGFPKRFDDFQRLNGSLKNVFFPDR